MKYEIKKTGLFKKFLYFIIFFIIISIFTYSSVEVTSTVSFCGTCHEMKPAVESWQISEHRIVKGKARANCRDCHIPSWKNPPEVVMVKGEHGIKDIYKHFFSQEEINKKDFYFAIKYKAAETTPNNRCTGCHSKVLNWKEDTIKTEDGTVTGLHRSIFVKNLSCIMCHKYTGHTFYQ